MCLIFFPLPLDKADKKDPMPFFLFFSNLPANIQGPDIRNNVFYEGAIFFLESESSAAFSLSCDNPTQLHGGLPSQASNLRFSISFSSETNVSKLG